MSKTGYVKIASRLVTVARSCCLIQKSREALKGFQSEPNQDIFSIGSEICSFSLKWLGTGQQHLTLHKDLMLKVGIYHCTNDNLELPTH